MLKNKGELALKEMAILWVKVSVFYVKTLNYLNESQIKDIFDWVRITFYNSILIEMIC